MEIYILEKNNIPFYVGKSIKPKGRIWHHKQNFGQNIKQIIIDKVEDNEWRFWECYWIEQFKNWGFILKNKNKGGGGPTKWEKKWDTQERRDKISNHPTRGKQISKSLKNHTQYYTKEIRKKMSKSQKGIPKPFTEEHKKNLSKANLESKGKTVECYTLNGGFILDFPCLREAKIWLLKEKSLSSPNVDKQIKDCCKGRQKTCHGFKFKYKK